MMKTFGEFKERNTIEESLSPQLKEILNLFDKASEKADELKMEKTLDAIEAARQEIISLAGA